MNKIKDCRQLVPVLYGILQECRIAIKNREQKMPIYYFEQHLNPVSLEYQLKQEEKFILNTGSLSKFVRLLQLMNIFIQNLEQGTKITKRNLFYKLQSYYYTYETLDKDIRLLCYNLSNIIHSVPITKSDLGVIASNRCIIYGHILLNIDGKQINSNKSGIQITTVPTCQNIVAKTQAKYIILIQKQSIFYNLTSIFGALNLSNKYLLMSAKGYPDHNTRFILSQLLAQKQPEIQTIYYLGDFDVYGFDIFLFYAMGDWSCSGILPKIQIIELAPDYGNRYADSLFDWNKIIPNMTRFTKQDQKKIFQIKSKLDKILSKRDQLDRKIEQKVDRLYNYFKYFIKKQSKCQLQMLFEYAYNNYWVKQVIECIQKTKTQ